MGEFGPGIALASLPAPPGLTGPHHSPRTVVRKLSGKQGKVPLGKEVATVPVESFTV